MYSGAHILKAHNVSQQTLNFCQQKLALLGINTPLISSNKINVGLNNQCFRVATQNEGTHLLKVFRQSNAKQTICLESALSKHNICPSIHAFDSKIGLIVYRYIDSQSYQQPKHWLSLIEKLKSLHRLNISQPKVVLDELLNSFNQLAQFERYKSKLTQCLVEINSLPKQLALCHNDLVIENILFDEQQVWLIDFEFAAINDVYFDLAAVSTSLELDFAAKQSLLKDYFEVRELKQWQLKKLTLFELVYNHICYFWYLQHGYSEQAKKLEPLLKG